jgi:hypothetical protein
MLVPQRLERGESRVEREHAVERNQLLLRQGDPGAFLPVPAVARRHDHREPVHRTTLEQADERLLGRNPAAGGLECIGRTVEKDRIGAEGDEREPAGLHECAS